MQPVDWYKEVEGDYRKRIIIDPDNPILAFKANRDRYTKLRNQSNYAGLPYLGSRNSEDALTWNVFRSLQEANSLDIISSKLGIGEPRGLVLWTLAPRLDEISASLQYTTGKLIRKYDGQFKGQMTEPDVILLGSTGIAVIECKLNEPVWEGKLSSVEKRLPVYRNQNQGLLKDNVTDEQIFPIYQLVRMAFYAQELRCCLHVAPVLVSLVNKECWCGQEDKANESAAYLWDCFVKLLGENSPRCELLFWQDIFELICERQSLAKLSEYLLSHPGLNV